MPTTSSNRNLTVPTVGGDSGVWGNELNTSLNALDTILGGTLILQSSAGTNITLTSSQAQFSRIVVEGNLSGNFTLTFPSTLGAIGNYNVWNATSTNTGVFGVLCQSSPGGGNTCTVTQNVMRIVNVDGTNAQFSDQVSFTLPTPGANVNMNVSGGGAVPTAGYFGSVEIPFTFTSSGYELLADAVGNATVTVFHSTSFGAYPGSSEATLTLSAARRQSGAYGPFVYAPGDIMSFNLNSAATLTFLGVNIIGTRSLSS